MKRKSYSLVNNGRGLEVRVGTAEREKGGWKVRREYVFLRVFSLQNGKLGKSVTVRLSPDETFLFGQWIDHMRKAKENTTKTVITRQGDRSLKLGLGRTSEGVTVALAGDEKVSVVVPQPQAAFLAHLLKTWSVDVCMEEVLPADEGIGEPEETEKPDSGNLDSGGFDEDTGVEAGISEDDFPF